MLKIAICDDETEICTQIENIIMTNRSAFSCSIDVSVYYSCERLCSHISEANSFDLVFLDIEMEGLNGLDLGRMIRNHFDNQSLQIVYISGKENYYQDLFDVRPMHFLLKPINPESLLDDIRLAIKLSYESNQVFSYNKSSITYKVPINSILYFQSMNREIKIVTSNGSDCFYGKLKDICFQLHDYPFLQIHKSLLVNYKQIVEFGYDHVVVSNSDYLAISQSKRKQIRNFQLNYETSGEKNVY